MSTVIFIVACLVLGLVVLSKIPGLELLVKPIVGMCFDFLKVSIENLWMWTVWLVKNLWFAHFELLQNLLFSAETLDPSVEMRNKSEG